jgi:Gpi18-like mannosyltransferase
VGSRSISTAARLRGRIALVLLLGLVIRALFLTHPGYQPDVQFYKSYLTFSTTFGLEHTYALETELQPPSPVFVYIFWGLGKIYTGLWPEARDTPLLTAFVKIPAVLGDLLVALLLAVYARRQQGSGVLSPTVAAALLALHPALIWTSAFWGQVDILHSGITAGAWGAAIAGSTGTAGCLLALGACTKPQGMIVLPLALALILGRSGWKGIVRAAGFGIALAALIILPFLLAGYAKQLLGVYVGASAKYPFLSINAFNPWWIVSSLAGGGWRAELVPDDGRLGPVTPHAIGWFLFALATIWILWRGYRLGKTTPFPQSRAWRLLSLQWLGFFLIPTQIHERYLLPALVSLAVVLVLERRLWWLYGLLSLGVLLNIVSVFPGHQSLLGVVRVLSGDGVAVAIALCLVALVLVVAEVREGRATGAG